jgi:hypothetical protein
MANGRGGLQALNPLPSQGRRFCKWLALFIALSENETVPGESLMLVGDAGCEGTDNAFS